MVTGPPRSIWLRKIGTTLPEEARTLPKRTVTKRVCGCLRPAASTIHSAIALEAPITVRGLTALSVEIRTKRSHPDATAVSAVTLGAIALLRIASRGVAPISGAWLEAGAGGATWGLEA